MENFNVFRGFGRVRYERWRDLIFGLLIVGLMAVIYFSAQKVASAIPDESREISSIDMSLENIQNVEVEQQQNRDAAAAAKAGPTYNFPLVPAPVNPLNSNPPATVPSTPPSNP